MPSERSTIPMLFQDDSMIDPAVNMRDVPALTDLKQTERVFEEQKARFSDFLLRLQSLILIFRNKRSRREFWKSSASRTRRKNGITCGWHKEFLLW